MVRLRALVGAALIAAAVPLLVVVACGPDFEPEVFVPARHPEKPESFAAGQLGVLQPRYARADLVVAYRYLHGGRLSSEEQVAYAPPAPRSEVMNAQEGQALQKAFDAARPVNQWLKARAGFVAGGAAKEEIWQDRIIERQMNGYVARIYQLNCSDGAFQTAKATLEERAKVWGSASADLQEWLHGQDQVFSNCVKPGEMPHALAARASALLRADRAYQIAATNFYAGNFDAAVAGFEAVGQDKGSPWSKWGEYLASRAEVRKAAEAKAATDWGEQALFDKGILQRAKARLLRVMENARDPQVKHAAEAELGFVQVRLEPEKRLNDVANALAGPTPDAEFAQHLADLLFLTGHGAKGGAELVQWIGKDAAFPQWKMTQTLPWLVAAISEAKGGGGADTAELMSAAAKVPAESPGYVTVNYHRARLLLESGRRDKARELAGSLLAGISGDDMAASRNAVLGLRIQTARSFAEFLSDAPRTVIETRSEASNAALCGYAVGAKQPADCVKEIPPQQFDWDAALAFNQEIPMARWVEAASGSALPQHLREAVAWAAWVRAVGLDDAATAKRLAPMLPEPVRKTAGQSTGFPATLAMLRNPGLWPYVQQGVQRSLSYRELDNFRDNWWCAKWGDGVLPSDEDTGKPDVSSRMPTDFLAKTEQSAAAQERNKLNGLPGGVAWLGRRAIAYVKEHPADKDGAEALGLTVRATRFGCYLQRPDEQKAVSKEAFQLLHRLYPKSVWADQTPYYY
jgi:tetratricopeptide (TPR) repeat protein